MDLYCVDVGQGSCNVLVLGAGRAIVIDCGPRKRELLTLLKRLRIQQIERLILSHCDSDHSGGAAGLMSDYRNAISEIWFPHDSRLLGTSFWKTVREEIKKGHLRKSQLVRLERNRNDSPRVIYQAAADSLTLKVFAPNFADNLDSHEKRSPNATSGIVVLKRAESRVVFSGDAGCAEWRGVYANKKATLTCDLLCVPHHGGKTGKRSEIAWLYGEAVAPRYAVISVGTANGHGHPREEVVRAIVANGGRVLCTQITGRCCGNLEAFRRSTEGEMGTGRATFETSVTPGGKSQHVACAGTIHVGFSADNLSITKLQAHSDQVGFLSSRPEMDGHPLCRVKS